MTLLQSRVLRTASCRQACSYRPKKSNVNLLDCARNVPDHIRSIRLEIHSAGEEALAKRFVI
jgi:hypothetical protein